MKSLSHHELSIFILSIGVLLIMARIFAELARKLKFPTVVGEIFAGILLGPTILGNSFPLQIETLFPPTGPVTLSLNSVTSVSVIMLLFVAGLEVELPVIWRQGRKASSTSFFGMVLPFGMGFGASWYFFDLFKVENPDMKLVFSMFMGTAMAISALPVIARILMDIKMIKTQLGMIILASAMVDDIFGWLLFSVVLGMMNNHIDSYSMLKTAGLTVAYAVITLTVVKKIIDIILPWIQAKLTWPGGVLSLALSMCFMGAAFTEYAGIHAVFGAFLMGIAFGDSVHFTEKIREIIYQFVTNIFAPLFFAAIGLRLNFIDNFDLGITLFVLLLAFVSKIIGAGLGARLGGLNFRESMVVGFGMTARGAMEIILGLLALQARVIDEPIFVALVIMAIVTSVVSGPMMQFFIGDLIPKVKKAEVREKEEVL